MIWGTMNLSIFALEVEIYTVENKNTLFPPLSMLLGSQGIRILAPHLEKTFLWQSRKL